MRVQVLFVGFVASCICFAQDFTLPTLKGDIVVKVTETNPAFLTSLRIKGTITNNTPVDLQNIVLQSAFYDADAREMTEVCRLTALYCNTSALPARVPAGKTVDWLSVARFPYDPTVPGIARGPNFKSFKLSLKSADYNIGWHFSLVKPQANDTLSFENQFILATFSPDSDGFGVTLKNKTTEPLSINWNNLSWVDFSGDAHKLIHAGVKLVDRELPQTPTVIPPLARITETLFPSDHIILVSSDWTRVPLWSAHASVLKDNSLTLKKLEGASMSLFMPLEINGKVVNYNFIFKVEKLDY